MEFRRLRSAQEEPWFSEAWALYEKSFPQHEQRLPDKQAALMGNSRYHFNALAEDGALAGLLLSWEGSGYAYIEHFAIQPSLRGRALGSKILETFCRNHSLVILEIDPPVDETAVRREHFYQRLGFKRNEYAHVHPAYQRRFPPHELVVMSHPHHLTEKEYRLFQRELRDLVMQDASD